jgi:hypothetical protein
MFSGRHSIKIEEDGSSFIDRDGEHFKLILNYLRDGKLPSDLSSHIREALAAEAEYYRLEDLVERLRALDFEEVLGDEICTIRGCEAHLRSQFYAGNVQTLNPRVGLISLFDQEPVTFSEEPMGFPTLLPGWNTGDFQEGSKAETPLSSCLSTMTTFLEGIHTIRAYDQRPQKCRFESLIPKKERPQASVRMLPGVIVNTWKCIYRGDWTLSWSKDGISSWTPAHRQTRSSQDPRTVARLLGQLAQESGIP